jgi:hypothetical protein
MRVVSKPSGSYPLKPQSVDSARQLEFVAVCNGDGCQRLDRTVEGSPQRFGVIAFRYLFCLDECFGDFTSTEVGSSQRIVSERRDGVLILRPVHWLEASSRSREPRAPNAPLRAG